MTIEVEHRVDGPDDSDLWVSLMKKAEGVVTQRKAVGDSSGEN